MKWGTEVAPDRGYEGTGEYEGRVVGNVGEIYD